jgi:hypothetical protein
MKDTLFLSFVWVFVVLLALLILGLRRDPLWAFWQQLRTEDEQKRREGEERVHPRRPGLWRWFWGLLAATLGLGILAGWVEHQCGGLRNTAAPHGIVSLEVAGDPTAARIILQSWGPACIVAAARTVWIDYLFIVAYVTFLHFLCAWASGKFGRRSSLAATFGRWVAGAQLVAGLCDGGENIGLLVMLHRGVGGDLWPWALATALLATTKFLLIGAAVIYVGWATLFLDETDQFLQVARTVRFSLGLSLLAPLVLLGLPQALDALRVLAEKFSGEFLTVLWFFVAAFLFAAAAWYWARVLVYLIEPDALDSPDKARQRAASWLPRFCGAAPLFLGAVALYQAAGPLSSPANPTNTAEVGLVYPHQSVQLRLRVMALLMLVLMGVGLYLVWWRRGWLERRRERANPRPSKPPPRRVLPLAALNFWTRLAMLVTALPGLLLWLIMGPGGPERMLIARSIGPIAVLLMGLGMLLPVGNFLVYAHARTRVPFLSLLLVAALLFAAFDLGDNHAVRTLRPEPAQHPLPQPLPLEGAFVDWLRSRQDKDQYQGRSYPVVFVAAEGGGIRAAYQTAVTLAYLQDMLQSSSPGQPPVNFSQHLFLISGVSGGSVGAAIFACLADRYTAPDGPAARRSAPLWETAADAVAKQDLLSLPLAAMLSPDLVQRFLPFALHHRDDTPYFDRALGLEYSLEQAWEDGIAEAEKPSRSNGDDNPMQRPFYTQNDRFAQRSVPALCFNTTRVESGDRMVVSTLRFREPVGSGPSNPDRDAITPPCLADIVPPIHLRLSTAACLSARFPLLTSSGYLRVARRLPSPSAPGQQRPPPVLALVKERYVDGGYFENSGLSTLSDVLTLLRDSSGTRAAPPWHPVVITLSFHARATRDTGNESCGPATPGSGPCLASGPGERARPGDGPFPRRPRPGSPFDDLLTPVLAFITTAAGHSQASECRFSEQMRRPPGRNPGVRAVWIPFRFQEDHQPLPLGWMLSQAARNDLRTQIKTRNAVPCGCVRTALTSDRPS